MLLLLAITSVMCLQDAPIILLPNKPINLEVLPYELYDLYVPVSALDENQGYWIKSSFLGGLAIEIIMKRKSVKYDFLKKP